jgi:glycosyltransferase involved in cell wall biosynthesis
LFRVEVIHLTGANLHPPHLNIIQLTPGAGAMYCGNCLRDNALVAALRQQGHQVVMLPLYLPLTLDEPDQSSAHPIFYSGISVYLDQKSGWYRGAPGWFRDLFASRRILRWAAGKAAKTRAQDLGEVTLSMLLGESGNQARQLEELLDWLKTQPRPDVICLSNALLIGMARRLKSELGAPVVCTLQGEDYFLDLLPDSHRAECWQTLAERAADLDLFIAPSQYFGDLMSRRLSLRAGRVQVIHNGISLEGYPGEPAASGPQNAQRTPPAIGFFARMCREKGLDTLVDAYILLRQRDRVKDLRLRIGGSCGPADQPFVDQLRRRLQANGLLDQVAFHPNLNRAQKVSFLRSLSVFSVPARYGEAFGLYVIEALAAGVPLALPRAGAFPELVEATGGGVLCAAEDPGSLAEAAEALLLNPTRAQALGAAGRQAVFQRFSAEAMARSTLEAYSRLKGG